ncbi:hypothetical protein [Solitalea canadensis]|uniref:Uncharacterized protein n=1 Tax=Solitalea canadensis (strain ATCC 29591 / DSM 3403 / JCM 21819 / LMG 8368 / NBRC 15130 / NCIMB 12057 / USAM 9D) TaxID=929556 RepID=H8KUJ9_SOLCM|nr:hypothetical protein [Solitalea canadensis]AFD07423.1 hypothetical protein Solca_2382 [Solitalea canadensis DSM 3403]
MIHQFDIQAFIKNCIGLISISFICSALSSIKGGIIFTPLIYGFYLCFTYPEKLRYKNVSLILLPLLFLALFLTGGGMFFVIDLHVKSPDKDPLLFAIIGIWTSQVLLVLIWALLKIKLTIGGLIQMAILVLPPYLLKLHPVETADNSIFLFYFLWQSGFSIGLSTILSLATNSKQSLNSNHS